MKNVCKTKGKFQLQSYGKPNRVYLGKRGKKIVDHPPAIGEKMDRTISKCVKKALRG